MANHVIYDRIWESDKLASCSLKAALAYPWIYLVADDWGRFEYHPRKTWALVFGKRKDVRVADVIRWLDEFKSAGLMKEYEVSGKRICRWTRFVGPPPAKRRQSMLPNENGVIENKGLKPKSRFHIGNDSEATKKTDGSKGTSNPVPTSFQDVSTQSGSLKLESRNMNKETNLAAPTGDGDDVELPPTRKERARDLHWEALESWMGCKPAAESERGAWNKALKQLKNVGATPEDILRRGVWYEQTYPDIVKTPTGLVKHWGEMANGPRTAKPSVQHTYVGAGRDPKGSIRSDESGEQYLQRMRREAPEIAAVLERK